MKGIAVKLLTTGEIAKQLNVDRDKVSYALRKQAIAPVGIAGQARVFPPVALDVVRTFLNSKSEKAGMEAEKC